MKYAYVLINSGLQMYFMGNDHETGLTYLQEARAIFQDLDNKQGQGMVLRAFSVVKIHEGDLSTAFAMAEEGAELYRACGSQLDYGACVFNMGRCNLAQGNYQEAKRCFKETLEMSKKYGLKAGPTAAALAYLGEAYRCLDEYAEAEACYRESLALKQEAGAGSSSFIADNINLGYAVLYRGDRKQAVSFFKEALTLSKERENKEQLVVCLAGFAAVAAVQGDAENSTLLYGAVESLVQTSLAEGTKLESLFSPSDCRELDHYQGLCRAQLGDSAFESAFERGHTITLDAALAFALERVDR
jgi:tetratricopeptide (TPR) repeat protein